MAGRDLRARIQRDVFLLDGAMGTQLFARGAPPGKCNDWLNVKSPDMVREIHQAYFNVGRPELVDGRAVYRVAPTEFAAAGGRILKAGIHILGGCGGTGPAHIRAVAEALRV